MDVEQHYQAAARILTNAAPDDWEVVWADVVVRDDTSKQTYDYVDSAGNERWFMIESSQASQDLYHELRAVRDIMAKETGEKWKSVRLTVEKTGKFHTKFNYDE